MKHIKCRADLRAAFTAGVPACNLVAALVLLKNFEEGFRDFGGWSPDEHGWVVVLEAEADLEDSAGLQLGERFEDTTWEVVEDMPELGCFAVTVILNNDFGMSYVVPKRILSPSLHARLVKDVFATRLVLPIASAE